MQYQWRLQEGMTAVENQSVDFLVTRWPYLTYSNDDLHNFMAKKGGKAENKQDRHGNYPRPSLSFGQPLGQRADPPLKVTFIDLKEYNKNDGKDSQRYDPINGISKWYQEGWRGACQHVILTNKVSAATSYLTSLAAV